jgi:hypothetical protein
MDIDIFIVAGVIGFLAAISAIIYIIVIIMRNSKLPIVTGMAEVVRSDANSLVVNADGTTTLDEFRGSANKSFLLSFRLENGQKVTFRVKKELYFHVLEHQTGVLTYQGYKLISFNYEGYPIATKQRKRLSTLAVFSGQADDTTDVVVYGECQALKIEIRSDEAINCTLKEVNDYLQRILNKNYEHFIVLTHRNGNGLEITSTKKDGFVEIVFLVTKEKHRYTITIGNSQEIINLIESFFDGWDLRSQAEFVIES